MPQTVQGVPCYKGHSGERYVTKNGKHGRCRPCVLELSKDERKELHLRTSYKLSMPDYKQLLQEQEGRCAICRQIETALYRDGSVKALSVDHDHKTGKVRGLLCLHCNQGLGRFFDSKDLLKKATEYLDKG